LEFLAREVETSPLLILGTYRDVEVSRRHPLSETLGTLIREQRFLRMQLSGLAEQEVGKLFQMHAGVSPSQGLVQTIHRRTEGNPLFVTEVVRALHRRESESDYESTLSLPEGVRDAIGRRLNRLSQECNQVLTTASVIGREFNFSVLQALNGDLTEESLLNLVDEASAAHVIEELSGGIERYSFTHALVQQTLLEELSARRRVRMHARIGEALEEVYGNTGEAHASELAYHFAEAEPVLGIEKLVRYSLLAGEQAMVAFAWEEALEHFQRGLDAKEGQSTDSEIAALLFGLGRAQLAALQRYDAPEAVSNLRRAFEYYVEAGDIPSAIAVAQHPLSSHTPPGRNTGATQLLGSALALIPANSLTAGELLCYYGSHLGISDGDHQGAQEAFDRALEIARNEEHVGLELRALTGASDVDYFHLRYPESLEKSVKAIAIARYVNDPHSQVSAYHFAARTLIRLGDFIQAQQYAADMLVMAEKLRVRSWLASALWTNATLALQAGDWGAARRYSDRGLAVETYQSLLFNRVLVEFETGDSDQGETYLQKLMEDASHQPLEPTLTRALIALGIPMVAYITGTVRQLEVAESIAEDLVSSPTVGRRVATIARAALGFLAVLEGNVNRAREQYAALKSMRGTILTGNLAGDRLLGLLAQTMGNYDLSTTHFEGALAFCRKSYRS